MKLHLDREADALYLRLDDSVIEESSEVVPGVVVDYDARQQVVGVEILHLSRRSPALNMDEILVVNPPAERPREAPVG